MKQTSSHHPRTFAPRMLSVIDFALGFAASMVVVALVMAVAVPSMRKYDPVGFGIIGALLLFPYALLALATGNAMRREDRGRWLLQALTLIPIIIGGGRAVAPVTRATRRPISPPC